MRWRRFFAGVAVHPGLERIDLAALALELVVQPRDLRPLFRGHIAQLLDHLILMRDMRLERVEAGLGIFLSGHDRSLPSGIRRRR